MNDRSIAPTRYEFGLQYIAGEWRQGRSSAVIKDTNRYNGETLLEMVGASVADADEAYIGAERAPLAWADMAPRGPAEVLRHAADLIEARREEIVEATIREVGGVRVMGLDGSLSSSGRKAIVRPGRRCSSQTRSCLTMAGHAAFRSSREMRSGTSDSPRSTGLRTTWIRWGSSIRISGETFAPISIFSSPPRAKLCALEIGQAT